MGNVLSFWSSSDGTDIRDGATSFDEIEYNKELERKAKEREEFSAEMEEITAEQRSPFADFGGSGGEQPAQDVKAPPVTDLTRAIAGAESLTRDQVMDVFSNLAGPLPPQDGLPPSLFDYAQARSRETGADMGMIVAPLLSAYSACIHGKTSLRLGSGFFVPPALWSLTYASSGFNKSMPLKHASKLLEEAESVVRFMHEDWVKETAERIKKEQPDLKGKDLEEEIQCFSGRPATILSHSMTYQGVRNLMDQPGQRCRTLGLSQDEIMDLFGYFEKDTQARSQILAAHDGGPQQTALASRAYYVENWLWAIFGNIQPRKMDSYQRRSGELDEDGLLQRFLMCVPAAPEDGIEQTNWQVNAEAKLKDIIECAAITAAIPEQHLTLSDGAQTVFAEFRGWCIEFSRATRRDRPALSETVNKYVGIAGRLMLVFHMYEHAARFIKENDHRPNKNCVPATVPDIDAKVSAGTARMAVAAMHGFFIPHALCLLNHVEKANGDLEKIARFILTKDTGAAEGNVIDHRAFRDGPKPVHKGSPEVIAKAVAPFESMGWLTPVLKIGDRHPKKWVVTPILAAMFEEQLATHLAAKERTKNIFQKMRTVD